MKEWMESVVEELMVSNGSGRRVISALTIAHCFKRLEITQPKQKNFLFPVFEMLELGVEMQQKTCPDFELIQAHLLTEHRYFSYRHGKNKPW